MNPIDHHHEREALNAFVDDELDPAASLAIEARIAGDEALSAEVGQWRALRSAVQDHADYHTAPDALRQRLTSADLRRSAVSADDRGWRRWFAWRPLATGFASACVLLLAAAGLAPFLQVGWPGAADDRLVDEVIASHVRSTIGQRLVDVASSDRHTVKPWLSSRLDFSPSVADAPVPGAVLLGGRVDYLDRRTVGVLVYRQRQHVIDVYVWPDSHASQAMRSASERGFNSVQWLHGGMRFWAVSDLNRQELAGFAQALDRAAPTP